MNVAMEKRSRNKGFREAKMAFFFRAVVGAVATFGLSSATDSGIPSDYTVVHANVVMRHGERSRLVKSTAAEFGNNDGVALTAEGEEECYEIGEQLRKRYINDDSNVTTAIDGLSSLYDADRFQIVSSGYDRTLESATALLLALYPPGSSEEDVASSTLLWENFIVVPIHSSDPENDPTILASDKCPVYTDNWVEFYRTEEFLQKQKDADSWITAVYDEFSSAKKARETPDCWEEVEALYENKLEFHGPYNLWDCVNVYDAELEEQPKDYLYVATPPETSSAEDGFSYLTELVNWLEDRKFEQSMTGRMVGGLWITGMFERMSEVVTHLREGGSDKSGRFPGMHITVGHYPTLKGIAGALNIGGLDGIPGYASHFSFELLYNRSANVDLGEEDFAVRIMYQDGVDPTGLSFVQMSPVFDADSSIDIDDAFASKRDDVTGIMGWTQFSYLMEHQIEGGPAYYARGEEEWCTDCVATEPDTCLRMELEKMTEEWMAAVADVAAAEAEKDELDDGVENYHVVLLSIFGVVMGIGIGLCIKPCLNLWLNKKAKTDSRTVGGDQGLESWPSGTRTGTVNGAVSRTGSFRLGGKPASGRHVLGGANGQRVNGSRAMALPTTEDEGKLADLDPSTTRIPVFAPTSVLGEPVPFPHRRQPSSMVSGVDSAKMTGVDEDHADYDADMAETTTPQAATDIIGAIPPDQQPRSEGVKEEGGTSALV